MGSPTLPPCFEARFWAFFILPPTARARHRRLGAGVDRIRQRRILEDTIGAHVAKVFVVEENEIDRYAKAIAHIADKGHAVGSEERTRAVNTYGTAFQLLVMRRGADYP